MCARACACVCQQLFRNPPPATPSPGRISCQPRAQPHSMVRFPISLSSEDCWPGSGWSKARSPCKNSQAGGPQTNMGLEVGRGGGQDQGDLSLCVTIPAAASRGPPLSFPFNISDQLRLQPLQILGKEGWAGGARRAWETPQ